MKVAIAGSRALPKGIAPRLLVRFLAALPEDTVVMFRRGRISPPGIFEQQAASVCELLGLEVAWMQPAATEGRYERGPGGVPVMVEQPVATWDADPRATAREATFARDLEMVAKADLVLCFYTTGQEGDETSGTASLVDKAIAEDRVVYAYAIDGKVVVRSGEHDPTNAYAHLVPTPA